jgi:outer membrane lipoprotein SlyB
VTHPRLLLVILSLVPLAACGGRYSADVYATRAVQQANPVQQGVVIGARAVQIQADGSAGAAAGAAAGGIVGGTAAGSGLGAALGGVGGGLVGGLFGSTAERIAGDASGTEYIVRKTDGELVNVTQRDVPPLPLGTRVLVIAGSQARIVPDYTDPTLPGSPNASGTPATVEGPVRADPPAATSQPRPPTPEVLPPAAGAPPQRSLGAPTPLVPPAVPLAI